MESSGGGGGGSRRRRAGQDQAESLNLRDFLRVRDEDDGRDSLAGLTLGAVLSCEKRPSHHAPVNRTLLDIIREEEPGASYKDLIGHNKRTWKSFKDRLRLRRAGSAWTSSVPIPASDVPIPNCRAQIPRRYPSSLDRNRSVRISSESSYTDSNSDAIHQQEIPNIPHETETENGITEPSHAPSLRAQPSLRRLSSALEAERGEQRRRTLLEREENVSPREESPLAESSAGDDDEAIDDESGEGAPVRMSLMALLEETDRQAGIVGPMYGGGAEEEEDEEEDHEEGGEQSCCVCMVRHKGAAFIPCGHTFCRLCSRELWVSRGNCPLCNNFILEILDIF